MVQRLPAAPPKGPSFSQKLSNAVGAGLEAYSQYQKGQEQEQQYQKENETYKKLTGGRDLSKNSKTRELEIGYALKGQQEGIKFKNKAEEQAAQLRGEQQKQGQLNQSFQKIQSLYNDPNLSEEQKTFGVYQELSQNPTLAHNILGSLNKQGQASGENVAGRQFSTGYNAIIEGDNDTLKNVLEDPQTPLAVKQKLTAIRDKQDTRKSVQDRELRGRQSLVQKSYKQAISNEREKLKTAYSNNEISGINKNIKKLEALQNHDMRRLAKNPDSYTTLSLWNAVDSDFLPEDEEEGLSAPMEAEQEKLRFDKSNPEHVARARQALQQAGGDRAKANQILSGEFSL